MLMERPTGKKVGAIEDIAAFSFYPSKNLGCVGEVGMITTDNDGLAVLCRRYRDHGSTKKFEHTCIGTNARMDGLNAAVLSVKLPHLDEWNRQRRSIAQFYRARLSGLPLQLRNEADIAGHVYHLYQIRLTDRDRMAERLMKRGISVTVHYPVAMHLHQGFSHLGYAAGDFPVAEKHARETLSIPCYPGMTGTQTSYVADSIAELTRKERS